MIATAFCGYRVILQAVAVVRRFRSFANISSSHKHPASRETVPYIPGLKVGVYGIPDKQKACPRTRFLVRQEENKIVLLFTLLPTAEASNTMGYFKY
jgi:hypothetical protein